MREIVTIKYLANSQSCLEGFEKDHYVNQVSNNRVISA